MQEETVGLLVLVACFVLLFQFKLMKSFSHISSSIGFCESANEDTGSHFKMSAK